MKTLTIETWINGKKVRTAKEWFVVDTRTDEQKVKDTLNTYVNRLLRAGMTGAIVKAIRRNLPTIEKTV